MQEKLRLLAVDDSRIIRIKIRQEFEPAGFEVFEAEDGVDALEKLADVNPDVITMDIDMPRMNGYEATKAIRTGNGWFAKTHPQLRSIPIVFLTANDTDEERQKGFDAGATEFVTKPFFPGELVAYVHIVLKPLKTGKAGRILVVDDSITVRMIVKSALETKGMEVIEAVDGDGALEILRAPNHGVDVVLTDYLMAGMSGDILCNRIREEMGQKALPIIFMTSFCEKKLLVKMFHSGANDYLIKPFISEELFARTLPHLHVGSLQNDLRSMVGELKQLHRKQG
jgi:CheY-like chemotaxis protein